MKMFYILLILLMYPVLLKAEYNKIQRLQCTSYKSLDEVHDSPFVKYLVDLERTFLLKFGGAPIRILIIPPNYDGNDDLQAQVSLSGKPETATIFELYDDYNSGGALSSFKADLSRDNLLMKEFMSENPVRGNDLDNLVKGWLNSLNKSKINSLGLVVDTQDKAASLFVGESIYIYKCE